MPESSQVKEVIARLEKAIPIVKTALRHENPFELLVATILSAQCTDVRVNQVTPMVFKRYPSPDVLASAEITVLEGIIRSTGFYKSKAKHLTECAKGICECFNGRVPESLEALVTLPGVGRKTANVILGCAFGQPAIVVDTHVKRVAKRLGWTHSKNPDQVEIDLSGLIPKAVWTETSHRLLLHGRQTCMARRPNCLNCPLYELCPAETEKASARR